MRMVLAVGAMASLCGCTMFPPPDPTEPPRPKAEASVPRRIEVPTVERWTQEQRDCETGDRKDQRRCVMPYPEQ